MYEIHLTINQPDSIERFKQCCKAIDIKPIVIATGNYDQVMTSSIYRGVDFMAEISRLQQHLEDGDFSVVRQKVEIMPQIVKHPNHLYYESHIRFKIPKERQGYVTEKLALIERLCQRMGLHKSRNLFKVDDEFIYQMATYRTYTDTIWQFGSHIEDVKDYVVHVGLWYDKVELEECIYDTNEDIDKKRLENKTI